MTPRIIEVTRPQPPTADRRAREGATAPDWPELIRALAATDEDELPVFGRMPG
jgi:hypothetical protein